MNDDQRTVKDVLNEFDDEQKRIFDEIMEGCFYNRRDIPQTYDLSHFSNVKDAEKVIRFLCRAAANR